MKILLCDDEIMYLNDLELHVRKYMQDRFVPFSIDKVTAPTQVINSGDSYDVAFLDIQMDAVNGISLAKELKKRNGKIIIFFVTNYNEYQDDAMDLRAFRFFEKPFDPDRLYASLDKAMEYIDESYVDIYIHSKGEHKRIPTDDIMYVMIENRRVIVVTQKDRYISPKTFDEWCDLLPTSFFYTVHKSFLVNLHYVDIYRYKELILNDGTRIAVASRKQADFHRYWFEYLRRR